ncbi:hypothetical protein P3H15_51455 [Rhodococcus sp. T2V]|nr:hypothetical protein [Rhodococcus sp. T2V]
MFRLTLPASAANRRKVVEPWIAGDGEFGIDHARARDVERVEDGIENDGVAQRQPPVLGSDTCGALIVLFALLARDVPRLPPIRLGRPADQNALHQGEAPRSSHLTVSRLVAKSPLGWPLGVQLAN